jgi:toxin FitB
VTRYLLDTNIIGDALKPRPSELIAQWLQTRDDSELFIATLTTAEIWRGILSTPVGRRRRDLESWFVSPQGPQGLFHGRVLSFDERAAIEWGRIIAEGRAIGRPRSPLDMVIAATAGGEQLHRRDRQRAALPRRGRISRPNASGELTTKDHACLVIRGLTKDGAGRGPAAVASALAALAILARACTSLVAPVRRALASSQLR